MKWYEYLFGFVMFLGITNTAFQLFKMTELDAASRGFQHPRLWGLFTLGAQNGSGLVLYLLGRRSYPSSMTSKDRMIIDARKKKIVVGLIFLCIGAIALIISSLLI